MMLKWLHLLSETSSGFTLTNVETQYWTVVTGFSLNSTSRYAAFYTWSVKYFIIVHAIYKQLHDSQPVIMWKKKVFLLLSVSIYVTSELQVELQRLIN